MSKGKSNVEDLVSEALLITDNTSQAIIEIQHAQGIVTLTGIVESEHDRLNVEAVVRRQEGVAEIVNHLHVLDR